MALSFKKGTLKEFNFFPRRVKKEFNFFPRRVKKEFNVRVINLINNFLALWSQNTSLALKNGLNRCKTLTEISAICEQNAELRKYSRFDLYRHGRLVLAEGGQGVAWLAIL